MLSSAMDASTEIPSVLVLDTTEMSTIEMLLTHLSHTEKSHYLTIRLLQVLPSPRAWGWHTVLLYTMHHRTRWQHSSAAEQICMALPFLMHAAPITQQG